MPYPVVFLPGNVVQPQAGPGQGMFVRRLELLELSGLSDVVGGGDIVARTPDPQARRFEYKKFLQRDLAKYDKGEPLHSTPSLAQFMALVEGLVYGHLTLKMYDLHDVNFDVPNRLRYLTVLSNRLGRVLGGTDPEVLVFSAANAADFSDLELANNQTRDSDGVQAQELLRGFKENLQTRGWWHPDHILWMKLLDHLFFTTTPMGPINLDALKNGWKQVGPVTLKVDINASSAQYRSLYLPVYESGYRDRGLRALSGVVAPTTGGLQLMVNNQVVGKILMPNPGAAGVQSTIRLGAGNLVLQDSVDLAAPIRINYDQLRPHLQSLVTFLRTVPNPVQHVAQDSPFEYPDAIRIPIQHDGFIALDGLRGTSTGGFSERFIERMKGKRIINVSPLSEGNTPPCLIQNQLIHCFADTRQGAVVFYVEEYQGQSVEELRLLGYILWSVFDKNAEVDENQRAVVMRGRPVLDFSGDRFEIRTNLHCEWPNPRVKAATLQRLVGVLEDGGVPLLFRESVKYWINAGFSHPIQPLVSTPSPINIGPYRWFINNI
ncbi:MAG TPA: hypothetical protein VJ875_15600 [Pyrinomonadaceae bacterium]|nr:hypothetical protein [Pyrinomonadaceae bacterium]